jgi:hypothetical protein
VINFYLFRVQMNDNEPMSFEIGETIFFSKNNVSSCNLNLIRYSKRKEKKKINTIPAKLLCHYIFSLIKLRKNATKTCIFLQNFF